MSRRAGTARAERASPTALLLAAGGAAAAGLAAYRLFRRWPRWSLRGRVALVTGGSRGLGFVVGRELLQHGAKLAFCARDPGEVDAAQAALSAHGTAHGFVCDVTDQAAVARLVADATGRLGPLDIVVNNAGQMVVGPLQHMTRADFAAAMDVHFGGALNVILAVLPGMRARRRGRIVNIASVGGLAPIPHMAPYVASKFALVGLSRALATELGRDGIRVTTVAPGPMRTGSALGARFKGRHRDEFAWFATTAALPVVSASALCAARRIVQAIRSGENEVVIGAPSRLLQAMEGLAPGVMRSALAAIERVVLPEPGGIGAQAASGAESTGRLEGTGLLARTEEIADELQRPS
jgi:NAD(P)-dependent dehydrogenase (short-subunit alcohol dehydrogenase family)